MAHEQLRMSPSLDGLTLTDLLGERSDRAAETILSVVRFLLRRTYGQNAFVMSRQEDIVQDVLLAATRRAQEISARRAEPIENLDAWLCRVTINAALKTWRNERLARHSEELEKVIGMAEPVSLTPENGVALRRALASIEPQCRELLIRKEVLGETRIEIAAALGITPNALGVRLHRCREKLREEIG